MTHRRQLLYPALYRDSVATNCLQHLSAVSHSPDQEMLTYPSIQNVHLTHRKFLSLDETAEKNYFFMLLEGGKSQYNIFLSIKI